MGSTTGCLPPLVQLMGNDMRLEFQESPFESLKGQGACVWSSILSIPRTKAAKALKFTYLLRLQVTGHIIYTLYLWILHSFKNLRLTKINIILLQLSRNSINSPPVVPTGIRFRLDEQPLRQLYLLLGLPTLNDFRSEPFAQGSPRQKTKDIPTDDVCRGIQRRRLCNAPDPPSHSAILDLIWPSAFSVLANRVLRRSQSRFRSQAQKRFPISFEFNNKETATAAVSPSTAAAATPSN